MFHQTQEINFDGSRKDKDKEDVDKKEAGSGVGYDLQGSQLGLHKSRIILVTVGIGQRHLRHTTNVSRLYRGITVMLRLKPLGQALQSLRPRLLRAAPIRTATRRSYSSTSQASRIDRISAKLPRRLQKYTSRLRDAPVSHVISFLILHELTAIVPLLALFGLFHYTQLVPTAYMTNHFGTYVDAGIAQFERYFQRKKWFGFGQDVDSEAPSVGRQASDEEKAAHAEEVIRRSEGDSKYKILTEVALAYAITKAALPIRIIGSVWATPWFAGVLVRARGILKRTA